MNEDTFDTLHDFAVVGAGIAGASVAWRLAASDAKVVLLERESQPGYHSTGRSAAMFMESYGTAAIRALTRASRAFYESPPAGFTGEPLLAPRGALYIASHGQEQLLKDMYTELAGNAGNVRLVEPAEALAMVPVLRGELLHGAILEDDAQDIDVNALHQGFLRGVRARGVSLVTNADLVAARREDGQWRLTLGDGRELRARHVVNAAGAWADTVAATCGVRPVGLEPRRRTAFTFDAPEGMDIHAWPTVCSVDESFYFKPDAGRLLGSPANADPVHPHDVVAEEFDVALGIHRIEETTSLRIRRPASTWAGLRSFVPDGDLVVGWDGAAEGFFWLAGQGGYGIQSAAAVSELAAAQLLHLATPEHILAQGLDPAAISPQRLR
ncbi:NAD(P)/FAD-dependent oxidoreductase [Ramlibacter sp.]|uniref:NAD(P)/FAD-dependent oxidoreductase n=1 Tax=Ramlibacter sp. TaxID=1917967 RepID=UPI003D0C7C63